MEFTAHVWLAEVLLMIDDDHIAKEILSLLASRDCNSSICPSEVARLLADDNEWRDWMPRIRHVGTELVRKGLIRITQGSETVPSGAEPKGPIRYRRGVNYNKGLDVDE